MSLQKQLLSRKDAKLYFAEMGLLFLSQPLVSVQPKCEISLNFEAKGSFEDVKVPENACLTIKYSMINKKSISFASILSTPYGSNLQFQDSHSLESFSIVMHEFKQAYKQNSGHEAKNLSF